ncbi:hypothetical protein WJX73_004736 [Symbiochloris irregularis]|uniref:Uncharacterized protein n=1 Tax=Symbiochloris irregularis TaxID=706552 RepID=A0AAW1PG16_9CHLO
MANKRDRNNLDLTDALPTSSPGPALSFSSWCHPIADREDSFEREETSDSCAESVQSLLCDEQLLDDLDLAPPVRATAEKRTAAGPALSPKSLYGASKRSRLQSSPLPRAWPSRLSCAR